MRQTSGEFSPAPVDPTQAPPPQGALSPADLYYRQFRQQVPGDILLPSQTVAAMADEIPGLRYNEPALDQ